MKAGGGEEQLLKNGNSTLLSSQHQGRLAVLVGGVDVDGGGVEQSPGGEEVSHLDRPVQRVVPLRVGLVDTL